MRALLALVALVLVAPGCGPTRPARALVPMDSYEDPRNPGWVRVISETGAFSVLMPASPRTDTRGLASARGRRFRAEALGSIYYVAYSDAARELGASPPTGSRIATLDAWQKREISNSDRVLEVAPAPRGEHPGRRIRYHRAGSGTAEKRVLLTPGRSFTLAVVSGDEVPFPEEDAAKFFASFELLPE